MKKVKQIAVKAAKKMAVVSAKNACGSASFSFFGQPKEPADLKKMLKSKV